MENTLTIKEFKALSKSDRAMLVAKDVIQQIKARRYNVRAGSYIKHIVFKGKIYYFNNGSIKNNDIKKNFEEIDSCVVCAIGSCILSTTKFANKLKFGDVGATTESFNSKAITLLNTIFTPKQQLLIECCFEGYIYLASPTEFKKRREKESFEYNESSQRFAHIKSDSLKLTYDEVLSCLTFKVKYKTETTLLVGIMENIIKNEGVFIP